ncbi:YeeE/YedE family protein [Frigidibacter sp. ROC022]|uniref:YeeE/YedE family protein n=1 Tax=Frigidibacter sp. ROC022 TaxID=2971796 RepID=UPI00215B277C|nr:YeeE/YedE thiosulfate transporter family protein [Frigidibacter sp. ROC022]MCR8723819.1 YeeE/YedE thiosulfate transporter family protein [Frigidibacter sp. ROC022]
MPDILTSDMIYGLLGGLMIGSAAALYLMGNARVMGASGILGGLVDRSARGAVPERLTFLAGLIAAPALAVLLMGGADWAGAETHLTGNVPLLVAAGLIVGLGTRMANGCTSGHGVCGISRLSPRGIVASATYVAAGILTMAVGRSLLGLI